MAMWPTTHPRYYWPNGFPLAESIENFVNTFRSQNFQICENPDLELGYEKIALHAKNDRPKHMARILPNGKWTSKLGDSYHIEHNNLKGLEGKNYGQVVKLLKRPIPVISE